MKIHEYQARQLLADAGVPVPAGTMVRSVDDAEAEARRLLEGEFKQVVIKAQVHAGGRGKAGFVRLVKTAAEAREAAPCLAKGCSSTRPSVTAAMMNAGPFGTISSDTMVRSGWGLWKTQRK